MRVYARGVLGGFQKLTAIVSIFTLVLLMLPIKNAKAASEPYPLTYAGTKTFDTTSGATTPTSGFVDVAGNRYVVGYFSHTVSFDGEGGSATYTVDPGAYYQAFLVKYKADGSFAFAKVLWSDTSGGSIPTGVAVDSLGNIYIAGYFSGSMTFDGPGGTHSTAGYDHNTSFLNKYTSSGSYVATVLVDASAGEVFPQALTVDSNDNVILTGYYVNTVVFDGEGGTDSHNASTANGYITKYSSSLAYQWTKTFDAATATPYIKMVRTDSDGSIYIAGSVTNGSVTFSGSDTVSADSPDYNGYYVKYSATGDYQFMRSFAIEPGSLGSVVALAVDAQKNVYLGGILNGTVDFGNGVTKTSASTTNLLVKYNANGLAQWSYSFSSPDGYANVTGIGVDQYGNVYVGGYFRGTVVFGGTDSVTAFSTKAYSYVASFSSSGEYGTTRYSGDESNNEQYCTTMVFGGDQNAYCVGRFIGSDPYDFDSTSATDIHYAHSNLNGFITKWTIGYPVIKTTPTATPKPKTIARATRAVAAIEEVTPTPMVSISPTPTPATNTDTTPSDTRTQATSKSTWFYVGGGIFGAILLIGGYFYLHRPPKGLR